MATASGQVTAACASTPGIVGGVSVSATDLAYGRGTRPARGLRAEPVQRAARVRRRPPRRGRGRRPHADLALRRPGPRGSARRVSSIPTTSTCSWPTPSPGKAPPKPPSRSCANGSAQAAAVHPNLEKLTTPRSVRPAAHGPALVVDLHVEGQPAAVDLREHRRGWCTPRRRTWAPDGSRTRAHPTVTSPSSM